MSTATLKNRRRIGNRQISNTANQREATHTSEHQETQKLSPLFSRLVFFFQNFSLESAFTLLSFGMAVLLIALFATDLIWGWPLYGVHRIADIIFLIGGLGLLWASTDVFMSQTRQHRNAKAK